jgi:hypothetical protein
MMAEKHTNNPQAESRRHWAVSPLRWRLQSLGVFFPGHASDRDQFVTLRLRMQKATGVQLLLSLPLLLLTMQARASGGRAAHVRPFRSCLALHRAVKRLVYLGSMALRRQLAMKRVTTRALLKRAHELTQTKRRRLVTGPPPTPSTLAAIWVRPGCLQKCRLLASCFRRCPDLQRAMRQGIGMWVRGRQEQHGMGHELQEKPQPGALEKYDLDRELRVPQRSDD